MNTIKGGKGNYKNILAFLLHTNYIMYQRPHEEELCCFKPIVVPKTFRGKTETTRTVEEEEEADNKQVNNK